MSNVESSFSDALSELALEVNDADAARVLRNGAVLRQRSRRTAALAFAGGLAAAAVTVFGLSLGGVFSDDGPGIVETAVAPQTQGGSDSIQVQIEEGTPCVGAEEASASELEQRGSAPYWTPSPQGPEVKQTWLCAGQVPALTFDAGTVFYEPGWANLNAPKKLAELAADYGGYTEDINGRLALIQPATDAGTKPQIMLIHGNTLVRILGAPDAPIDGLLEIAMSLELDRPGR